MKRNKSITTETLKVFRDADTLMDTVFTSSLFLDCIRMQIPSYDSKNPAHLDYLRSKYGNVPGEPRTWNKNLPPIKRGRKPFAAPAAPTTGINKVLIQETPDYRAATLKEIFATFSPEEINVEAGNHGLELVRIEKIYKPLSGAS